MTIGPDDYCCGEFPPLCASDFPDPAAGVVDNAMPAPSNAGGLHQPTWDSLLAENAQLLGDLAAARQARDTAQAQATHYRTYYTRSGW
jgi:hypothetical protein